MVVAGVMGLRLGEVQEVDGNPFRGSIGAEGGWMGVLHRVSAAVGNGGCCTGLARAGELGLTFLGAEEEGGRSECGTAWGGRSQR